MVSKQTTDQWEFFQIYQKYLKNSCWKKCHNLFLIIENADITSYSDENTPYVSADKIDMYRWGY